MGSLIEGWNLSASQLLAVLLVSLFSSLYYGTFIYQNQGNNFSFDRTRTSSTMATPTMEIYGVKIERNPNDSRLTDLGVTSWPKWECSPSKFPWTFKAKETMYLVEGKVKVYCDGYDGGSFEIGAGDLVEFPKGMKVTWDVIEAVNKHYSLDDN